MSRLPVNSKIKISSSFAGQDAAAGGGGSISSDGCGAEDRVPMKKDPCQRQACDIQECLQSMYFIVEIFHMSLGYGGGGGEMVVRWR